MATKPPSSPRRPIQCYHCRHKHDVSGIAQTVTCPKCSKGLMIADVVVDGLKGPMREIRTCGKLQVGKKGKVIADLIQAQAGIECEGAIESKHVYSGGRVVIGPKAAFRGALCAPALSIGDGAKVVSSSLKVPDDSLPPTDSPRSSQSTVRPKPLARPVT